MQVKKKKMLYGLSSELSRHLAINFCPRCQLRVMSSILKLLLQNPPHQNYSVSYLIMLQCLLQLKCLRCTSLQSVYCHYCTKSMEPLLFKKRDF